MTHTPLPNIDVHRKLNAKRLSAFGIVAMLLLTVFVVMFVKPGNPTATWWWIPGTCTMRVQPGSSRNITITTGWINKTAEAKNNITVTEPEPSMATPSPAWDQYDVIFGEKDGNGLVNLTVPKESFVSKPFFLRNLTLPGSTYVDYIWGQLVLVRDGNGTLDTAGGNIDVDMYVNVTGNGNETYAHGVRTIVSGSTGSAGSLRIDMPLNLSLYVEESDTVFTGGNRLTTQDFPVWLTTGKINVTIDDSAGPFPSNADPPGSIDNNTTSAQGVPADSNNGSVTVVACGGGIDLMFELLGEPLYSDFMFKEVEILAFPGAWWYVPGEVMVHAQQGSSRNITITTGWINTTENAENNITITEPGASVVFPICDRYNTTFGLPDDDGLVNITIPKESFISAPFFLRNLTLPGSIYVDYIWGKLIAVDDSNGTLDTTGGKLDVDMYVNVTGNGNETYASGVRTIVSGSTGPAGSMRIDMALNLSLYVEESDTVFTGANRLTTQDFPVWLTTGKTNVTIDDSAGPFPSNPDKPGSIDNNTTSAQGSPLDPLNGSVTVVACGGGIELMFNLLGQPLYSDFMFNEVEIIAPQLITGVTLLNTEGFAELTKFNIGTGNGTGINQFEYTANVTITVKAIHNATLWYTIHTETITDVEPGEIVQLTVAWNITNVTPAGYKIKVYADGTINVYGTKVTSVDTWLAGTVVVALPGDFDCDGDVDVVDFIVFGGKYGQKYPAIPDP